MTHVSTDIEDVILDHDKRGIFRAQAAPARGVHRRGRAGGSSTTRARP